MIHSSSTGGGPKEDLSAWVGLAFSDSSREIKEVREGCKVWNSLAILMYIYGRYGSQRRHSGEFNVAGQRYGLEITIYLEGNGLILPIQVVLDGSDAPLGVLGRVMVCPGGLEVAIIHVIPDSIILESGAL